MHQNYVRPQTTVSLVAGDIWVAEAREAMQSAFGSWARGGTTLTTPVPPRPTSLAPTTIYLKDSPGLAQSLVSASLPLPVRDNADAAAIDALASLLGDATVSSGSRFYNAFRVERGLSYGPSVQLITRPVPEWAPIIARAPVAPAVTDPAVML